MSDTLATPRPALSTFDAAMIVVGIVIGGGIFSTPGLVAGMAGSPSRMLAAWALGGVLSMVGTLVYAELGSAFPNAGGDYHFLTRAYGRDLSFFFGWARATVIQPGSIAIHVFIFGDYMTRLAPLGSSTLSSAIYATVTVLALTALHLTGVRQSARTQNLMSLLLLAGLALLAAAAIVVALGGSAPGAANAGSGSAAGSAFGLAMVFVLFTFGGWNEAAYISAELTGGRRAILRALGAGLAIVTVAYLLVVAGLLNGLGFGALAASQTPAADLMQAAFGSAGAALMAAIVSLAILSSINATMLSGARSNYAFGGDWAILSFMNRWDGERGVPRRAFIVQAVITIALIALGASEQAGVKAMVEFTAPVFWFFFLLAGIALFVLRAREPEMARPFRVPLYPVLPLVFIATCAYLLYSSVTYAQSQHAVHVSFYVMGAGAIGWVIARMMRGRLPRVAPQEASESR